MLGIMIVMTKFYGIVYDLKIWGDLLDVGVGFCLGVSCGFEV